MNRRAFLRSVSAAAATGLLLPELAKELLTPPRTIFLPRPSLLDPFGILGPPLSHVDDAARYMLSTEYIEREMLRLAESKTLFRYTLHARQDRAGGVLYYRRPHVYQRAVSV